MQTKSKSFVFMLIMVTIVLCLNGGVTSIGAFSQDKNITSSKASNVFDPSGFSSSFNNGQYQYIEDGIRVFAKSARDPGVYFETIIRQVSNYKYFVFEIKGNIERLGQWCFPVVQIYDMQDDDYTPSITKTSFTFSNNEYTQITIPLEGKIKRVSKIQFMLVTDRGSWDVAIKNARFE